MDELVSPKSNNDYVAVNTDTDDQETRHPFLPGDHFRGTCHSGTSPSKLLNELLPIHKKISYKQIKYVSIFFVIFGIISLIVGGLPYILPECKSSDSNCRIYMWTLTLSGVIFAGIAAVSGFLVGVILCCMSRCQLNGFSRHINQDEFTVWTLTDSEWVYYLDYMYGPDRTWHQDPCELSFCCRRKSYERLANRQYGHIILHKNGFIIDELYLISFQTNSLLRSELVNIGANPNRRFLRIHVLLTGGKNRSEIYFDLLAPSSVDNEHLQALVQYYLSKTTK